MRVIAGRAKGRKLKKVPGDTTRPIMDRVKENLFNILGRDVEGTRWLDLFAGTGQVGIEALSRGAEHVLFVDTAVPAIRTIRDNLQHTGLAAQAKVVQRNAFAFLQQEPAQKFDVIYVAPPQYKGIWAEVLKVVGERPLTYLTPTGIIIIQIDPKEYEELPLETLSLYDQRKYGNTQLDFYEIANGQ
ncbi:MAG: 16S rRNA (guanine(966)-N(2))-methyltransferase RsmD [Ardenticatenaceae bacterium]|nr:16S rRNA (guanine(966)-N(2))-methyltransferase RsmD [Ardenticatenaceae bacterium]MCB9003303.1 16S rRNA (guanine(966)-N(2))-methyltransferase RsmD [Ardenticatenaceae bacterium]